MASHIFPSTLQTTVNCYSETVRVHNESRLNNQILAKANALQLCTQSHYRMSQPNCQLSNLTMESVHLARASLADQIKRGLNQKSDNLGHNEEKIARNKLFGRVPNAALAAIVSFVYLFLPFLCQLSE